MRFSHRRRELVLATLAGAGVFSGGCATLPNPADVSRLITDRSREWTSSYTTGTTEVMEQIIADDFVGTAPDGARFTKAQALQSARRGPTVFASSTLESIDVKVYGNAAIALGSDALVFRSDPAKRERTAWTDTWLMRNGLWQCVASHETVMRTSS